VTLTTNKEKMSHAVSVPISRCVARTDAEKEKWKECRVYLRYFHKRGNEYDVTFKELQWGGCAYFRDLVIEASLPDQEQGWVEIPKPFIRGYREGYRETVRYPRKEGSGEARLFYLRWQPEEEEQETTAVVTETAEGATEKVSDDALS